MRSYLLRAVLPSWKFFEDHAENPVLLFRAGPEELGDWLPWLEKRDRRWRHLFLNPRANDALASGSLLQRLVHELSELEEGRAHEFEHSVTYQLVKGLVSHRVAALHGGSVQYQFKVRVTDDVLVSPVYEA